jgi:hypothetical protein
MSLVFSILTRSNLMLRFASDPKRLKCSYFVCEGSRTISYTSSIFTSGCCSKCLSRVWYNTSIVADCTLVQTARGPTPLNQPAMPSVLYIIFRPVITEDVSSVAALWTFRLVEGEEVEMDRVCEFVELIVGFNVVCREAEDSTIGWLIAIGGVTLCWVWMRVFTTSRGVVKTPAMPPALAAVATSSGSPMLFEPMYRFARARSSS